MNNDKWHSMNPRTSGTYGGIQFPDALLAAREAGKLVIFAGAGVSVPWPSCLPNFGELVKDISEGHAIQYQDGPYDHYLGKLHSLGVNVHQRAFDILSKSGLHRHLHEDLLRLFDDPSSVRLVTTNFDGCFSTASKVVFPDEVVDEFCAPALPLGNNFNGIVYLHGRLSLFRQGLVLTDADFGRAYVTEGWSRRFLISLFQNFTVLFVGYRHEDPIMHHLARGIARNREDGQDHIDAFVPRRFSLIGHDNKPDRWEHLGIEPILYQVESGDGQDNKFNRHRNLDTAIHRWVSHCRRSNSERVDRLQKFAEDPVHVADPDKVTEIQRALSEPYLAKKFLKLAKSVEWLDWFDRQGLIAELFEAGDVSSREDHPSLHHLANWFAEQFKTNHSVALSTCHRHGGKLHAELVWRLFTSIAYGPQENVPDEIFESGGWLLLQQPEASLRAESWGQMLERCKVPQHQALATEIFRKLTLPKLELVEEFVLFDEDIQARKAIFQLTLPGLHEAGLHNWVDNMLRNHLDSFGEELGNIFSCHLGQASNLSSRTYRDDEVCLEEFLGYGSYHRGDDDLLLRLAQRLIEELGTRNLDAAILLIKQWGYSKHFVLNRLALHGLEYLTAWTADEKVNWVMQYSANQLLVLRDSVSHLLEVLWSDVSNDCRNRVVEWLLESPVGLVSEPQARRLRALFCALEKKESASSLAEVKAKIAEKWPRIRTSVDEGAIMGPPKPNVMDRALQSTGEEWVEVVIREASNEDGHYSNERKASEVLLISGKESLNWHLGFLEAAVQRPDFPDNALNYWFSGWRESSPDTAHWQRFFDLVDGTERFSFEFWKGVAGLMLRGVERKEGGMPDELLSRASAVAVRAWPYLENDFSEFRGEDENRDWLFLVLNRAPGDIARFWLSWIARAKDFDHNVAHGQIATMASSRSDAGALARVAFCWYCRMLYNRAPKLVVEYILPLLDWQRDEGVASRCWSGFLHDNWHQDYIPVVLPHFEELLRREAKKREESRRDVVEWVVFLVFDFIPASGKVSWLISQVEFMNERMRTQFAHVMRKRLFVRPPSEADSAWSSWIAKYLAERSTGLPAQLCPGELAEIIYFPVGMDKEFINASEWTMHAFVPPLFSGRTVSMFIPIIKTMNEKQQALHYPDATAKYVIWLLNHTRTMPGIRDDSELEKLKKDLEENRANPELLEELKEALVPFN